MKKFCTILMVLLVGFMAACSKESEVYVVSVEIEDSFKEETIYVGDSVDFSEFDYIVTYNNGATEVIDYSVVRITGFSTQTSGQFEMTISYKGKNYKDTYTITQPTVLSCTYKGGVITLYKGEQQSDTNAEFIALYTNGDEVNYNLSLAEVVDTDLTLTDAAQNVLFSFGTKTFVVPCKVTYRPIEENVQYEFVDSLELYNYQNMKIIFSGQTATLVSEDRQTTYDTFQLTESSFNRYTTVRIIDGDFVTVWLYLIGNNIYINYAE